MDHSKSSHHARPPSDPDYDFAWDTTTAHPPRRRLISFHTLTVHILLILLGATLTTLLLTTLWPSPRQFPPIQPGTHPVHDAPNSWFNGDCGTSSTSALHNNCVFSLTLHAWLPPSCITDSDLEDEEILASVSPWPWTNDAGETLSVADVRKGDFEHVWTNPEWHLAHCMFVWKRLHRVFLEGGQVDSYTVDARHTEHCGMMVMTGAMGTNMTKVVTKFPSCA